MDVNKNAVFRREIPVEKELSKRRKFSEREVGFNHPDNESFMRLNDQGDIEIFATPGIGIVISAKSKSISFFADTIKFSCKEDGLKWNSYYFNYSASSFSEPTLVKINLKDIHTAQNGASYYLDTVSMIEREEKQKPITILAENKFSTRETIPQQKYVSDYDISDLSFEEIGLLEAYASSYSELHIALIVKHLRQGLSFDQAHAQASKETNE
jgi:hypothetical protein